MKLSLKFLAMLFAPLLFLSLAACDREEGPAEEAGEAIDEAVDDAGDAVEDAGDAVKDATN